MIVCSVTEDTMDWYYTRNGERTGPVERETIKALLGDGTLSKDALVWNAGMGQAWAKISDVPALAGPQTAPDDPKAKQEFLQKMEERKALVARQRRANIRYALIAVAVAVLLVFGVVAFVRSKPLRQWGISPKTPLGTLAKLETRMIGEYQMEKESLSECADLRLSATRMFRYSKPKCPLGEYVGDGGQITLRVGDNGSVDALFSTFASPGQRGYLIMNRSLASIFMNELWRAHSGAAERKYQPRDAAVPAAIREVCGLVNMPDDGSYAVIEKPGMRCLWIEHGPDTVSTIVYMEAKR
jgi:hypothetical protein